jgi:hypothetical protein
MDGIAGFGGGMLVESTLECGEVQVPIDPAELLAG